MLANLTCWVIAFGIMLSKSISREDLYIKMLLAMGFIFLGILSKAVEAYYTVNNKDDDDEKHNGMTSI